MSPSPTHEQYRAVFEHSMEAVLLTAPDGTIHAANPAACAMFGRSEADLCAVGRLGLVDPASPELGRILEERARSGRARGELLCVRGDGTRFACEVSSEQFTDSLGASRTVMLVRDLTQRKQFEQRIAESEVLLSSIVNSTRDLIWMVEPETGSVQWFNESLRQFLLQRGIRVERGMPLEAVVPQPQAQAMWRGLIQETLRAGSLVTDYTTTPENTVLQLSLNVLQREGRVFGLSIFGRDVTEQKRAERLLLERQADYESLVSAMAEGVVFQGSDGRILSLNPAAERIEGRTAEEMLGLDSDDPSWAAVREDGSVFPGDQHPAMVTLRTGQPQSDVVMGIQTPAGERRWISINSAPVVARGDAGPRAVVTTFRDITRQRHDEQELRIAARAFEGSQEAMMITDARQVILRVNRAFTQMTGFSVEDAVGQTPAILRSHRHSQDFYRQMWESLHREHHWEGEIWNRRKTGELYPEWLRIMTIVNEAGAVSHYVAVFTDMTAHKKAEEAIFNLAFYDPLTGLPNRRLLQDRLKQALLATSRMHHPGALLFIDLDSFKTVNDSRGHEVGDRLLREITRRLKACVHAEDTLARLGSDEFALVLDTLEGAAEQSARQAEGVALQLQHAIQQPVRLDGQVYYGTACIGLAMFPATDASVDELMRRADTALNQAKANGRGQIHFYDAEMQKRLESFVWIESSLRLAIPEQLRLHYQIQVDGRGKAVGAEALIRWPHPERGLIAPATFIPLAERTGLIEPIGRWVLETACRQLKAWEADPATRHLLLSLNVSARQFHQPDFVDQVLAVLRATGADPSRLELELTESMLVENVDAIIAKMTALKAVGVLFSLDDFGTGYSSLSYLKRLPLDQLKIDQSFVRDIATDPNDAAIVRTIVALGQSLGLAVIAEGVETEEQKNFLAMHGCNQYQGYLFSRPVPVAEFEQLLRQR